MKRYLKLAIAICCFIGAAVCFRLAVAQTIGPGQSFTTPPEQFVCKSYTVTCSGTPCDLTKPPPDGCGPVPPVDKCVDGTPADLPGFKRNCGIAVNYSYSQPIGNYTGATDYTAILGAFPVGTSSTGINVSGQAIIFPLARYDYVSLPFTATVAGTVKFVANTSWGGGGTISVSDAPGKFLKGPGVCATQNYGGSNALMISSNNFSGAQCKVALGYKGYLNIVNAMSAGTPNCANASCNMAYTVSRVN